MNGLHSVDLATTLATAHREEIAAALRARPGPLRQAVGRRLVGTGLRLIGSPTPNPTSASVVGS